MRREIVVDAIRRRLPGHCCDDERQKTKQSYKPFELRFWDRQCWAKRNQSNDDQRGELQGLVLPVRSSALPGSLIPQALRAWSRPFVWCRALVDWPGTGPNRAEQGGVHCAHQALDVMVEIRAGIDLQTITERECFEAFG